jgi:hypothetical protein
VQNKPAMSEGKVSITGNGDDLTLNLSGNFEKLSASPSDNLISKELDDALKISYKRALQRVVKEQLPAREKEILTELGCSLQLLPDIDTFTTTASLDFLDNIGGLRLLMALRTVALEPTAKDMVAKSMKKVVFRNVTSENDYCIRYTPESGELFLACQFDRLNIATSAQLLSNNGIFEELMSHLNVRVAQKTKEIKEKVIPEREGELKEILKGNIKYDVGFRTFKDENQLGYVDNVSCFRVSMACRCLSEADKTKVAQKIKTIRLENVASDSDKKIELSNGVVLIQSNYTNGLSGAFSDNEIRAFLAKV